MVARDLIRRAERVERPSEALVAIVALRAHLERLELRAIRRARRDGCSWTEIAAALGVSRQALHQRVGRLGVR